MTKINRKWQPALLVLLALAAFVLYGTFIHGGGQPGEESFVGRVSSGNVKVRSDRNFVTFTNADGEWTFFRRCQGTDVSGIGYIGRFVSRTGYVVSNDYQEGGFAELNSPEHGGIGTFGLELARGAGERDWNNTQHLSMRRCGSWGATHWSGALFGVGPNAGYYDQDVILGDDIHDRLVRARYRWRIDDSDVRLYAAVDLCPLGAADCAGYFAKEPKVIVNVNGQASPLRFAHLSTFAADGTALADALGHNRECSYAGRNARAETGHCFDETRERVRIDYAATPSGGCLTTQPCFNVVFRSLPTNHASLLAGPVRAWEQPSSPGLGLDRWALDAASWPRAGDAGCVTIDGQPVYSPDAENARNWEYAVFAGDDGYAGVTFMAKAWDGCKNSLDATALYRELGPASYGWFMSVSLGEGWTRE